MLNPAYIRTPFGAQTGRQLLCTAWTRDQQALFQMQGFLLCMYSTHMLVMLSSSH